MTAPLAHAARVVVEVPETLSVGEQVQVPVSLFTEGEVVNAVEGVLRFSDTINVVGIVFSGSVVPLWAEQPSITDTDTVAFAGVLPGGYQNGTQDVEAQGNLFSVIVEGVAEGGGFVRIGQDTSVYRNDGSGTELPTTYTDATFSVIRGTPATVEVQDTVPPEALTLSVIDGSLVHTEGKVLVFIAQDKDSAIERYEIGTSWLPFSWGVSFVQTHSPYSVKDIYSFVHVRAYDAFGNSITKTIAPHGTLLASIPLIVILMLAIACALVGQVRAMMKR
jgi:hypothetical protein